MAGGLDFKHPGGKEYAVALGAVAAVGLAYYLYKKHQAAAAAASNTAPSTTASSPTGLLLSWMRDHSSSSTTGGGKVTVPNVVGMTDAAADAAITGAGLKVADVGEPAGGVGQNGTNPAYTVASQSPAAGSKVQSGSTVTVTFKHVAKTPAKKSGGDG